MKQLKHSFIFIFLALTFDLCAQEMNINDNKIDEKYVPTLELKTKFTEFRKSKKEIILITEKSSDSVYSIYAYNNTLDSLKIDRQDWHLYLIQEAKNKNNQWKPIEYWKYSNCGNSYFLNKKIKPNGIIKTESTSYDGSFKTKIRFKLLNDDKVYYSNAIDGTVNLSQFELDIKTQITGRYTLEGIRTVGGIELLEQVMFLEPKSLSTLARKHDEYLKNYRTRNVDK